MTDTTNLDSMEAVIDTMVGAGNGDRVSVGDMIDAVGDDAYPPLMLVPALVAVTPASGIPGLTATCGLIIALISAQMVLHMRALWLPGFLRKRSIARSKLETARNWLEKPARLVDRVTGKRLAFLVRPPFDTVPALICLCIGLGMPFLEFIPFSGSIAATTVAIFALALTTEDGILALLGTALLGSLGYLAWTSV